MVWDCVRWEELVCHSGRDLCEVGGPCVKWEELV